MPQVRIIIRPWVFPPPPPPPPPTLALIFTAHRVQRGRGGENECLRRKRIHLFPQRRKGGQEKIPLNFSASTEKECRNRGAASHTFMIPVNDALRGILAKKARQGTASCPKCVSSYDPGCSLRPPRPPPTLALICTAHRVQQSHFSAFYARQFASKFASSRSRAFGLSVIKK